MNNNLKYLCVCETAFKTKFLWKVNFQFRFYESELHKENFNNIIFILI